MRQLPAESIFSNTSLRQDVFSVHSCCKKAVPYGGPTGSPARNGFFCMISAYCPVTPLIQATAYQTAEALPPWSDKTGRTACLTPWNTPAACGCLFLTGIWPQGPICKSAPPHTGAAPRTFTFLLLLTDVRPLPWQNKPLPSHRIWTASRRCIPRLHTPADN